MNHRQRLDHLESTMPPDRQEAIDQAAAGTLSDLDLEAITEKAATVSAFDQARHDAALARAPGARHTLAELRKRYAKCRTLAAALALFRAARGQEPDRDVEAALRGLGR